MLFRPRIAFRLMSTSMMQASAFPHNEDTTKISPMVYDKEGTIVPRNYLVLRKEEEIEKYVLNLLHNYFRTCNKAALSINSYLPDHGLDSLDAVELVVRMEDELGYVIPAEALPAFKNARAFVNYIKQTEDFKAEFNKNPIN
ncbi:unnamed protein product [Blepharisma stoltei]|uniref:Acyl carrier protein n=1 Tax=Blepharisma stoltei TaxID=1481888 RepID=A0AAU9J9I6_9CILI|nr:unnamed protein product [Blepharisma stoltei]